MDNADGLFYAGGALAVCIAASVLFMALSAATSEAEYRRGMRFAGCAMLFGVCATFPAFALAQVAYARWDSLAASGAIMMSGCAATYSGLWLGGRIGAARRERRV